LQKSTKSMLERLWQQQQLIMERLIKENVQGGNPFWAQADRNNIHAAEYIQWKENNKIARWVCDTSVVLMFSMISACWRASSQQRLSQRL
jgi:hypothetical protein